MYRLQDGPEKMRDEDLVGGYPEGREYFGEHVRVVRVLQDEPDLVDGNPGGREYYTARWPGRGIARRSESSTGPA